MDFKKIGVVIADDMEFLPLVELVTPLGYEKGEINSYETISFIASLEVTEYQILVYFFSWLIFIFLV